MNILEISKVVLTLVPVIGGAVQQAEQIAVEAQQSGKAVTGAQKLQFALGVVKGLYDASSPPVPFEQIVGQVSAIVNEVVAFFNAIQAFKKAAAPLAQAA
jgi:hypothetical protein